MMDGHSYKSLAFRRKLRSNYELHTSSQEKLSPFYSTKLNVSNGFAQLGFEKLTNL